MKTGKIIKGLVLLAMIASVASAAVAAEGTDTFVQPDAKHFHEVDTDLMKKFHNPMEGLELGLDLRLREVYNSNMSVGSAPFSDDWHWQRYRFRLGGKYTITEDVNLNFRYVWEFWNFCDPEYLDRSPDWRNSFFDRMNIEFKNAFDMPATLTVGRQDIILGTGWLILEGTPTDGSRSIFFDAIRYRHNLSETSSLDLIYINQQDDLNNWLPRFDHSSSMGGRNVADWNDEQGFIAYYTNKGNEVTSYDAYFIYKNEEQSDYAKHHAPTRGYDAEIYTVGGRLFGALNDNWSYSAELAGQWGDRNGADLSAFGTNNKLIYSFNDDKQSQLFGGYEYLSGDDPGSSDDERFDPLWSGYPQSQRGGDLQVYMWTPEYGNIAEIGNLHRLGGGYSFKPSDTWTMVTQYNALWADEDQNAFTNTGTGFTSGDSKFRGHLVSWVATYQCCKKFKAHFMVDYLFPGDFYPNPGGKDAYFTRVNLEWTF
ncbi:MAG: alginate export family protein [Planctomycetota bacterium]|jgi:hypothetical protein